MPQPFRQDRDRTAARVLEHNKVGFRQADYRLEADQADIRIEDEIRPLLPSLTARAAHLEWLAVIRILVDVVHDVRIILYVDE